MREALSSYRVNPKVLHRIVDEEAVMLDLDTGEYFGLNPVGAHIWQLLSEHCTLPEIIASVRDTFEAPDAEVADDVKAFVSMLTERRLIVEDGENGASP